jgi:hypothetical protein
VQLRHVRCPALTFSAEQASASLDSGQSCSVATANGYYTVDLTSGDLTVAGSSLSGSFTGSLSGTAQSAGQTVAVQGTMTESKMCTRM